MEDYKKQWQDDLEEIMKKLPNIKAKPPKLFFVPFIDKIYGGGANFFNVIFVSKKLQHAPKNARKYILVHEYAHMYCHHSYLALCLFNSTILYALLQWGCFEIRHPISSLWLIFNMICSYFVYINYNRAEKQADDLAILITDAKAMYEGCKWVSNELNVINKRKDRLSSFKNRI